MIRTLLEVAMASLWLAAVYSDVARDVTRTWLERMRTGSKALIEQVVAPKLQDGIAALRDKRSAPTHGGRGWTLTTSPRG